MGKIGLAIPNHLRLYSRLSCTLATDRPVEGLPRLFPRGSIVVGRNRVIAARDSREPGPVQRPHPAHSGTARILDPHAIFAAIGEVPYDWWIDSDALAWGPNSDTVLAPLDPAALASGRSYAQLISPQSGPSRSDTIMRSGLRDEGTGVPYQVQYALRPSAAAQVLIWIEDSGRWFAGPDGKPLHAHGVVRVINERRERENRLTHLAQSDSLTGEMNRVRTAEVLEATIEYAVKVRSSCGFLLAAIDGLGRINEAYGFDVADEVIAAVAKRMHAQLRGNDHLGRLSGNKFGIILNNCTPDDLPIAADRLLTEIRDGIVQTTAGPVAATVTIGGIAVPRHARNVNEVFSRAQDALYVARNRRHGSFEAYRPNPEREIQRQENVRATDETLSALKEGRIFIVHEPIVEIGSRKPAFYECLMRIKRADGSLLAVNEFIPWAERLGLVHLLDHRVLDLVATAMIASPGLNASVNISAASTGNPDWWAALAAMLRAHPGIGARLTLEITETAAIQDIDHTRGFVARVKDLGCRIAIDDFGAGFTSFRNLRKLGVDLVKIDGAFVKNLKQSQDDRAFVHTLIDLARRLGIKTVAEWVQDEAAAAMLAEWGCDYLQGALIGLASSDQPWKSATEVNTPARDLRRTAKHDRDT
jgi:diguanylate cyclase (GGDEF)-like protein